MANILHKCSSFSCMCNIDDDDGMTHIIQGLSNNSTFQSIDLSHIKIDCERAAALSQLLHGTTLQKLSLSNSKLGDNEATEISQNLKQNCTLKHLSLSGKNTISHNGTLDLARALQQNSALQELILHDVHIGDNATEAIAQALLRNSTLQTLQLSCNEISDDGVKALAKALKHNSSLQILDLGANDFSTDGAVALARALYHNSSLQELELKWNDISDPDMVVKEFVQALTQNSSIFIKSGCKGLILPERCMTYVTLSPQYTNVKHKIYNR